MTISANLSGMLPMMRIVPPSPMSGYLASVYGFLPSVKLLASSGAEHLRGSAMLGGLVIECALKAYLLHMAEDDTKRETLAKELPYKPYGHDLEALWSESVKLGLEVEADPPDWCVRLNAIYFQNNEGADERNGPRYQLRYQSKYHGLAYPPTKNMAEDLPQVVRAVELAMRQP